MALPTYSQPRALIGQHAGHERKQRMRRVGLFEEVMHSGIARFDGIAVEAAGRDDPDPGIHPPERRHPQTLP